MSHSMESPTRQSPMTRSCSRPAPVAATSATMSSPFTQIDTNSSPSSLSTIHPHSSRPCSPTSQVTPHSSEPTCTNPSRISGPHRTSIVQQRISISARPRRSSPLLHEIQPPSRRLSSHQMLLLTPFGGSGMSGSGNTSPRSLFGHDGGGAMARGSSSMGRSAGGPVSRAPPGAEEGSGPNDGAKIHPSTSRQSYGASASLAMGHHMAAAPSSMGMTRASPSQGTSRSDHIPSLPQSAAPPSTSAPAMGLRGTRHSSFGHHVNPSPLSRPMKTIPSGSSNGTGGAQSIPPSREASESDQDRDANENGNDDGRGFAWDQITEGGQMDQQMRFMDLLEAVPMMRSNSLPVLTLRELDALREKDGELGISRGSNWAWVSRDDEEDVTETEDGTQCPSEPEQSPVSYNHQSSFAFQDPFAHATASPTSPVQPTHNHGDSPISYSPHKRPHDPIATSDDYRYSPTNEIRRMSDAPPTWRDNNASLLGSPGAATSSSKGDGATGKAGVRARHSISAVSGAHLAGSHRASATTIALGASPPQSISTSLQRSVNSSNLDRVPDVSPESSFYVQAASNVLVETPAPEAQTPDVQPISTSDVSPPTITSSQFFNSRASMSAIAADTTGARPGLLQPESPQGSSQVGGHNTPGPTRPRILRYKTSPARFTGLGLNIVVKAVNGPFDQGLVGPNSAGSSTESGSGPSSAKSATRRTSQVPSFAAATSPGPRKSSHQSESTSSRRESAASTTRGSTSSGDTARRRGSNAGVWTNVNMVDAFSHASVSAPPSATSSTSFTVQRQRQRSTASLITGPSPHDPIPSSSLYSYDAVRSVEAGPSNTNMTRDQAFSPRLLPASIYTVEHVSLRSELPGTDAPDARLRTRTFDSSLIDQNRRNTHTQVSAIPRNMQFNSLRGRGRYDSVDSGSAGSSDDHSGGAGIGDFGRNPSETSVGLESLTLMPRRGSLAVLTQTALGPWATISPAPLSGPEHEANAGDASWRIGLGRSHRVHLRGGEGKSSRVDEDVDPLHRHSGPSAGGVEPGPGLAEGVRSGAQHHTAAGSTLQPPYEFGKWQERRGSWAEGWGFK